MTTTSSTDPAGGGGAATAATQGAVTAGGTDWATAIASIRSISDWIVKTFSALGAVLVAGIPLLTHLDKISADGRGIVAVGGAVCALAGIGVIIWAATEVNLNRVSGINELQSNDPINRRLRARISATPAAQALYLAGATDLDDLLAKRSTKVATLKASISLRATISAIPTQKTLDAQIAQLRADLKIYDATIGNLQSWSAYEQVRATFVRKRRTMFVAASVSVVGLAVWIATLGVEPAATDPPKGTTATAQGSVGQLTWTRAGTLSGQVTDLREQLGLAAVGCAVVPVVVESGGGDAINPWQVVVLPSAGCPENVRFTVDRRFATIAGFDTTAPVDATVTIGEPTFWQQGWLIWTVLGVLIGAGVVAVAVRRRAAD